MPQQRWSLVAVLVRPWGNRGELLADSWSAHPDRLAKLRTVYVAGAGSDAHQPYELEWARPYRERWIVKLRGVDSIGAAETLAGAEMYVPLEERPPAPDGEYYQADLVGCEVQDRATGRRLGTVTGWVETGGPALLAVERKADRAEILIPFARSICVEIDPAGRRIVVELPEGLEELNRP